MDARGEFNKELPLQEVHREGDQNVPPPVVGKVLGHGEGGDRDGFHAAVPKKLRDLCGLVGLHVGPPTNRLPLDLPCHGFDVPLHPAGIKKKGGSDDHGQRMRKSRV